MFKSNLMSEKTAKEPTAKDLEDGKIESDVASDAQTSEGPECPLVRLYKV